MKTLVLWSILVDLFGRFRAVVAHSSNDVLSHDIKLCLIMRRVIYPTDLCFDSYH